VTNRLSQYLSADRHPLDRPEFVDRLRALRVVCLGIILGTAAVVTLITLVVRYALNGRPIVQNGAMAGDIPIVTAVGLVLTLGAVAVAAVCVPVMRAAGLRTIATAPPPPPDTREDSEADRLWQVYAKGKFVEYAVLDGAAIATAVLYHLSADWLMIGFVVGMLAYLAVRLPTADRVRAWFDGAAAEVDRLRGRR
jgi:hypothetical protein